MFDFSKALEETLKSQDGVEKALKRKILPAGKYAAIIKSVEQIASKAEGSKSQAYRFTYLITEGEQAGEEVREDVYFLNRQGEPTEYAQKTILRRLLVSGYTTETLKGFRMPKTAKDPGDFIKIFGRPVSITVENKVIGGSGPSAGQVKAEVARVESGAAASASQAADKDSEAA